MRLRIFRGLLTLLPATFRAQFGPDLLETAASLDRTMPVRIWQAPAVLADAIATVVVIRREMRLETESVGAASRKPVLSALLQDVRFAVRGLRRDLGLTSFVVAALTLGIGANAAMFGIVDRLLVAGPLHIQNPAGVVRLYLTVQPEGMRQVTTDGFGEVTYEIARRESRSFTGLATYTVNQVLLGEGADARLVQGGYASETLFPLLGVRPELGRFFNEDENRPGAAQRVTVLGYGAWQQWFTGRSDVLGQRVIVGGDSYVVVGVAPRGFTGPQFGRVDLWLPMNLRGPLITKDWQTSWNAQWLEIIGRLVPGVTSEQASAEITDILQREYTGDESAVAHGRYRLAPISANNAGVEAPEVTVVRWLAGVALVVLLIACANVANLLLVRGLRRSREVALRAALGAGRGRLIRLLLVESLLLSGAGAIFGLAVAYGLGGLARRVIFSWVDWEASPVDARVLGASALLAIVTGLLIGVLPSWRATRVTLVEALKCGVREGGGQRSRLRHGLTIFQGALSVVLLVGAGLFVRSLWNVRTLPLGFDSDRVIRAEITRPPMSHMTDPNARDAERTRRALAAEACLVEVRRLPGVDHASLAIGTPFGNRYTVKVQVPGLTSVPRLKTGGPSVSAVGSDYFATVGTRILRGRAFGPNDRAGSEPVAIVSDTMARTVWPGQDPIGQCLMSGDGPPSPPCSRIVGIAEDTHRDALQELPVMHYYVPFGQEAGFGGTVLLLRTSGVPADLGPEIRHVLFEVDPTIRFVSLDTIQHAIDPETKPWTIGAMVFSFSGLLALIVAAIGIYSVMSYLVADRTHEIGVRLALGARPSDVARLILGGSLAMAVVGVTAGSLIAVASSRFVGPLLFNESPRDPLVYLAVAGVLLAVALVAGVVPTLRANRIDPLEALRVE